MKVVVTGATGSLGTALLRSPATAGWEVVGVVRRPPGARAPYDRVRWVACDIGTADAELDEAFAGADAVVHLAWAIQPRTDEPDMWRTNSTGTARVLRAAADAGVGRLVCVSSVAAYSPGGARLVDESWPCDGVPGSAYSAGKADLERRLAAFATAHPDTRLAWVRPCAVVQGLSADQIAGWTLPPWMPRALAGRRWLPVPLWKRVRAQLVHADDVADLIVRIVHTGATGPFNATADPVLRAGELAKLVGGFRLPLPRGVVSAAAWLAWRAGLSPAHPGWLVLTDRVALADSRRAREELGWSPHHDGASALGELVDAVRSGRPAISPALAGERGHGRPTHQSQAVGRRAGTL